VTQAACPREKEATGPEVAAWRVGAHTPQGVQGIGVMVAPCGRRWRARIVSFPNVIWMVPGGGESVKFLAARQDDALRNAIDFVRHHCVRRGYTMRDELECVGTDSTSVSLAAGNGSVASPRVERRLPVHFGVNRPTMTATTANLSASGLFISTDTPTGDGAFLGLSLELEYCKVPLRAEVAWHRRKTSPGTISGMGLLLIQPPGVYVKYIEHLIGPDDA